MFLFRCLQVLPLFSVSLMRPLKPCLALDMLSLMLSLDIQLTLPGCGQPFVFGGSLFHQHKRPHHIFLPVTVLPLCNQDHFHFIPMDTEITVCGENFMASINLLGSLHLRVLKFEFISWSSLQIICSTFGSKFAFI